MLIAAIERKYHISSGHCPSVDSPLWCRIAYAKGADPLIEVALLISFASSRNLKLGGLDQCTQVPQWFLRQSNVASESHTCISPPSRANYRGQLGMAFVPGPDEHTMHEDTTIFGFPQLVFRDIRARRNIQTRPDELAQDMPRVFQIGVPTDEEIKGEFDI